LWLTAQREPRIVETFLNRIKRASEFIKVYEVEDSLLKIDSQSIKTQHIRYRFSRAVQATRAFINIHNIY
jgi:hypothetical protein